MKPISKGTAWHEIYHKIAVQLQSFYRKHTSRSGQELFNLLNDSTIFKKHNSWLTNVKRITTPSLEPIQVFVSFSRAKQNEDFRTEIINEVLRLLTWKNERIEKINFEGCPTPVALKLQYIRPETVQNRIWESFNSLMEDGVEALNQNLWAEVQTWRGIKIPSFTIFLFWIESGKFLPLDKNTRLYLESSKHLESGEQISLDVYKKLLSLNNIVSYTELSLEAYYFNNFPDTFKNYFGAGSLVVALNRIGSSFKIIGVRTLSRNSAVHKILRQYEYYPLDSTILPKNSSLKSNSNIESFSDKNGVAEALYNLQDLKINITAIVGKNGSGKSTLFDLLMMGIYNLSIELGYLSDKDHKPIKRLNFELYWVTDTLYKLSFKGKVSLYSFTRNKNEGEATQYDLIKKESDLSSLNSQFFYSILVNYSHYALNNTDYKIDWITPLSHKNDGYITPLVINPKRTEGNIEINNQRDLLNMRLLLNLIELHDADLPRLSFRHIDNGKFLKYFSIYFDESKQEEKIEEAKQKVLDDPNIVPFVFEVIADIFKLDGKAAGKTPYIESIKFYLFNKMVTIVERYNRYRGKFYPGLSFFLRENVATTVEMSDYDLKGSLKDIVTNILEEIKIDNSHISLKFKQVINYLRFPELQRIVNNAIAHKKLVDLDDYQILIFEIVNTSNDADLSIAELLPPPIFKLDFHIDDIDKSSFSKASSGEFQMTSILSSVIYHIRNIDSVEQSSKYSYVSVLLDETELYFHPNMQRYFIRKLLESLSKLENNLYGIHILFATHSPFILSDIKQQKILKLDKGKIVSNDGVYNTFAANIHDLLADDFFLEDGYMGAFAQKQIEIAINLLNYLKAATEIITIQGTNDKSLIKNRKSLIKKLEAEKSLYTERLLSLNYWKNSSEAEDLDEKSVKGYIEELIEIIGEPIIKEKLSVMFHNTFNSQDRISTPEHRDQIKQEIFRLMRENQIERTDLF